MTKNEMLEAIRDLRQMPYCCLQVQDFSGEWYLDMLTAEQYDEEMRRDRPWCGPHGEEAEYDDERSEAFQEAYYAERKRVRELLKEYNATHKQQLKL